MGWRGRREVTAGRYLGEAWMLEEKEADKRESEGVAFRLHLRNYQTVQPINVNAHGIKNFFIFPPPRR